MSYQPSFIISAYTINSKILSLVSDIVERITDIKHQNVDLNLLRTFEKSYEIVESYNHTNIDDILKSHKLLMGEILSDAGSYRSSDGEPPANIVDDLMIDLFEWLKTTNEHPLIVSCVFHYEFEYIHPFSDGNAEIGKLWQSVILYHYKKIFEFIPIENVLRDNEQGYTKALEDSQLADESTPFIEFILKVILESLKEVGKRVGNNIGNSLSENKMLIIQNMRENKKISAKKLSDIIGISVRKIEENIAKLRETKIIRRVDGTRGYWEVA